MNTELPFKLHERRAVSIPLAVLIGLLGAVASAAMVWNGDRTALAANTAQLSEHSQRLRKLEEITTQIEIMKNDVEWIRRIMEERRANSGP